MTGEGEKPILLPILDGSYSVTHDGIKEVVNGAPNFAVSNMKVKVIFEPSDLNSTIYISDVNVSTRG